MPCSVVRIGGSGIPIEERSQLRSQGRVIPELFSSNRAPVKISEEDGLCSQHPGLVVRPRRAPRLGREQVARRDALVSNLVICCGEIR